MRSVWVVSIPAGFSDALRVLGSWFTTAVFGSFQSLLGFLMRCEFWYRCNMFIHLIVSIPAGFSDALRDVQFRTHCHNVQVSIPAGFSDALRAVRSSNMTVGQ